MASEGQGGGLTPSCPPQVRESRACRPGLELPTVLLEMEWSRRAQEQVGGWPRGVAEGRVGTPSYPGAPSFCSSCGTWSC